MQLTRQTRPGKNTHNVWDKIQRFVCRCAIKTEDNVYHDWIHSKDSKKINPPRPLLNPLRCFEYFTWADKDFTRQWEYFLLGRTAACWCLGKVPLQKCHVKSWTFKWCKNRSNPSTISWEMTPYKGWKSLYPLYSAIRLLCIWPLLFLLNDKHHIIEPPVMSYPFPILSIPS